MINFYPFKLEPQLKEKVWGGSWLVAELGRAGNSTSKLGESWEAFSGSVVANGRWQGHTLGELYQAYKADLGGAEAHKYPNFPLLVKFIDARENLSVQVHPNDALAQTLENYPFGKSEMWYIMAAEPNARILYSLNDKATSQSVLAHALKDNNLLDYINSVPVHAGDVVNLPSGTVHALCAGIVVYELQQESDITYRLYDWGRTGREIHLEKGLQAINMESRNLGVTHPVFIKQAGYAQAMLVDGPYFSCELWEISNQVAFNQHGQTFALLSVIEGKGAIAATDNGFETEEIKLGDTVFLPATLNYVIKAQMGQTLKVILGTAK